MKQFLLLVSVLTFVGTQVVASSSAETNCEKAVSELTQLAYGGASVEFLRDVFERNFAENSIRPDDTFIQIMEDYYRNLSTAKREMKSASFRDKAIFNMALELTLFLNCSSTFARFNWR